MTNRLTESEADAKSKKARESWKQPEVPLGYPKGPVSGLATGMRLLVGAGSLYLPIETVSVLNTREHWSKRAKRAKAHRELAGSMTLRLRLQSLPSRVTLIRVSPRKLDGDNLQGALKAVRDGVADGLGIDDGDPRVKWEYEQEKGGFKAKAVRVRFK